MMERQLIMIGYGAVLGAAGTEMMVFVTPGDGARSGCLVILSAIVATSIVLQRPRWR